MNRRVGGDFHSGARYQRAMALVGFEYYLGVNQLVSEFGRIPKPILPVLRRAFPAEILTTQELGQATLAIATHGALNVLELRTSARSSNLDDYALIRPTGEAQWQGYQARLNQRRTRRTCCQRERQGLGQHRDGRVPQIVGGPALPTGANS